MAELIKIKRPSPPLIKLVESFGTLLGIQKTERKSHYKAPLPSNYDAVLHELDDNFSELVFKVASMQSSDLSNQVATEFFAKSLEPGFSYEAAVNTGGLMARELFNAIALVLARLQLDESRIPINTNDVLVLTMGSRSSYSALDAAMHVYKHGVVTIASLTIEDSLPQREKAMLQAHLPRDLLRRVKMHYKLPDHCFSLEAMNLRSIDDVPSTLAETLDATGARTLVMGIEEDALFGEGGDCGLPIWATTYLSDPQSSHSSQVSLLLVKGRSKVRPFTVIKSPRTFVIYIDRGDLVNQTFLATLSSVRAGDTVVLVYIAPSREPVGDCRGGSTNGEGRFSMGVRSGWVDLEPTFVAGSATGSTNGYDHSYQPNTLGWNDDAVAELQAHMQALLAGAKLDGEARVEWTAANGSGSTSVSQTLCNILTAQDADVLVLSKRLELEVIVDCVQEASCSVLLV